MNKTELFKIIILIGRPASGKSEIIDFLRKIDIDQRRTTFHIGRLDIIDDFPMLWTWFEEDHILRDSFQKPGLHTDHEGYFLYPYLWDLLIKRIGLEYSKRLRDNRKYHDTFTSVIEFSRGKEHGGYQKALKLLPLEIIKNSAICYVNVPFKESLRKNRQRFNPERPDSILEHALPDEKLERLYKEDDWSEIASAERGNIIIKEDNVPYVVFNNQDDVTSSDIEQLHAQLGRVLGELWLLYKR